MDGSVERPEKVKPVWCPMSPCGIKFGHRESTVEQIMKDIQHHLYMRHGIDAIKAHVMAKIAVENEQQSG